MSREITHTKSGKDRYARPLATVFICCQARRGRVVCKEMPLSPYVRSWAVSSMEFSRFGAKSYRKHVLNQQLQSQKSLMPEEHTDPPSPLSL